SLLAKLLTVKSLMGCSSPRRSPGPRRSASATGCGFRSGVGCRALLTSRLRAVLARGGCVGSQIAGGGVVGSADALAQGAAQYCRRWLPRVHSPHAGMGFADVSRTAGVT